jgi:hypothetical protein
MAVCMTSSTDVCALLEETNGAAYRNTLPGLKLALRDICLAAITAGTIAAGHTF